MPTVTLLADSGATKAEWSYELQGKTKTVFTQGISPYFLSGAQIAELLQRELVPKLKGVEVGQVHYYGTGCAAPKNAALVKKAIKAVFKESDVEVQTDLMAAARSLFGGDKGIACILGTGCNSGFYNGKRIAKNSPGIGYILGDEGSGAYLGKKAVQYYLYKTYDSELMDRFETQFKTDAATILDTVYKKPLANRYLASFALFLLENRGHYMIENILEDGLNDFFFQHLCKYREIWTLPVSFVGSVSYGFRDVLEQLCRSYEFSLGTVVKNPMQGLLKFHAASH